MMERLFSPWRSEYIATFSKKKKEKEACLFCRIMDENSDDKNYVVARCETCFVMMNLYPYNSGHLMVIPYMHTASMKDLPSEQRSDILKLSAEMMEALDVVMSPDGYNFGANLGRVAGAGIDQHIHFHIVPRWNGDTNFMPTLADVKVVSEALDATHKKIKTFLLKEDRSKTIRQKNHKNK